MTERDAKSTKLDRPQVKFPPPALYLAAVLAGWGLEEMIGWRPIELPDWIQHLGAWLVVLALLVIAWTVWEFRRHRTTILPHRASSAIITRGPFRFSRNPIYLAFATSLTGLGLMLSNAWMLLLVPVCVVVTTRYVIVREEAFLGQAFGEAYTNYLTQVRRWL